MQFLKYNRGAAIAALAALIVLSVLFGVNRSVSSLAGNVEDAYTNTKVQSDLTKYVTYAQNFAAAYTSLYGEDAELTAAIEALRDSLASPLGTEDRLNAISALASTAYYTISLDTAADETVKTSAVAYYAEMQSTAMRLSNNTEYKKHAAKYNDAILSFPAALLAPGRKPAVTFG